MKKIKEILCVGGDLRTVYLANELSKVMKVNILGNSNKKLNSNIKPIESLKASVPTSDIIIFPIPFSKDKKNIYAPFSDRNITIEEVINQKINDKTIIGGAFSDELKILEPTNTVFDLVEEEDFEIYNAIPTSEGVIHILMSESEITINESQTLILGFGKCAISQSKALSALGSHITISARNQKQIAMAKIYNYNTLPLESIHQHIEEFDFIVNTIPRKILDAKKINHNQSQIIVDIANQLNDEMINKTKIINARGIPGKYFPKTAADIIYKTLKDKNHL
ncbi:dipicolinate synthase subunit A [Natranaerovirga hydrolytica]|uniref:Dipicolinate synthase subunit A n=1 Tax=Natranaerovirga hydrolytica TaxID=680378 RepID=A0A4R1MXF7_9FIRM|nr:dipicolinate synthase subunit DpsA [Natranaerovirga hydrolytica]TCK97948.1 dipicolinate synthase subunit A [Natranaerovirga hydrolytica]